MEQLLSSPAERHRRLLDEVVATVEEHNPDLDQTLLERAFEFACMAHEGHKRRSGEDFIVHPAEVARILGELRMDSATVAAALLHDVVEDTDMTIDQVRAEFGDEIAGLVEGVTKLTRIKFQSREQAQAENYRKMIVAMAQDIRVILIKLGDRLHNMRTIEFLGKQKQFQIARETLEVYAPIAHRLGIHQIKWELEDLAFQTLHPRKHEEIQAMVAQNRADREAYVGEAGGILARELEKAGIKAEIAGRAKHFYSIYEKMVKRGKEFNEIYDLTAMRVIVERSGREGQGDCYAVLGILHSLWKPMPGRFKDFVAMPKHVPLPPHDRRRTRGQAARDPGSHPRHARHGRARDRCPLALQERAQGGQGGGRAPCLAEAAHGLAAGRDRPGRVHADVQDRPLCGRGLRLHAEGRGEVSPRRLDADRLRLRRPYGRRASHRRCEGERSHRPAPLPARERRLRRDPHVEAARPRPVARLAAGCCFLARA
jgi:hypothetical protein